jgi:hypothetical protein
MFSLGFSLSPQVELRKVMAITNTEVLVLEKNEGTCRG